MAQIWEYCIGLLVFWNFVFVHYHQMHALDKRAWTAESERIHTANPALTIASTEVREKSKTSSWVVHCATTFVSAEINQILLARKAFPQKILLSSISQRACPPFHVPSLQSEPWKDNIVIEQKRLSQLSYKEFKWFAE